MTHWLIQEMMRPKNLHILWCGLATASGLIVLFVFYTYCYFADKEVEE